jgi:ABC-type transporter Mla subunit MlaD
VQPDSQREVGSIRASSDAQEQARELLLGVRSALPPTAQSAVKAQRSSGDAQESARQLLLGVTTPATPASGQQQSDVSRATQKHVHGDAQLLARAVLLGRL